MSRWCRWAGLYLGAVIATVLAYAIAYNVGMTIVENDPQSFLHSLEVVLTHFATVGYATEFPSTGAMTALVAVITITGQIVIPLSLLGAIALGVRELPSSRVRN